MQMSKSPIISGYGDDLDFLQMNGYVPCGIYSI